VLNEGPDGDRAAAIEVAHDLQVAGAEQRSEIAADDADAVFVEIAMIPEGVQVLLQGFAFHQMLRGNEIEAQFSPIRLAGHWAKAAEAQAILADPHRLIAMGARFDGDRLQ
jgi:hypothetical protein